MSVIRRCWRARAALLRDRPLGGGAIEAWGVAPLWTGCLVVGLGAAAAQVYIGTGLSRRAEERPAEPPRPATAAAGPATNFGT
ncbi:hypothetical protein ACIRSU_03075 [Streptomyces sp. NPDC101160]|uniref:hypothetical protein n=1 Tax=Streptomyces sp. NPDC101160 TaxID=3366118 RepID=UPI003820F1C9